MLDTGSLHAVLPDHPSKQGWRVNESALEKFLEELGLEKLVVIRYSGGRYTLGAHRTARIRNLYYHRISISQRYTSNEANVTLLHEIAHAFQAEEFARSTGKRMTLFYREEYKPAKGEWGKSYQDNFYEIKARQFAYDATMMGVSLIREREG